MESESENIEMASVGGGGDGGGGGSHQVNSRWNPTKEQISLLESLYRQGIRTPTADQIQQITSRLQAYGHIEGKNVFYWFQNHKARQRQKQKQESISYINRCFLHHNPPPPPPPLFAPPCPNVVCGSYYLPQSELGFYPPYPKVLLPSGFKRRQRSEKIEKANRPCSCNHQQESINGKNFNNNQETLPLFPLHPTGFLQGKAITVEDFISTTNSSSNSTDEFTAGVDEESSSGKPFFDFFSGQGSF